jgi:hypothetical protein
MAHLSCRSGGTLEVGPDGAQHEYKQAQSMYKFMLGTYNPQAALYTYNSGVDKWSRFDHHIA